MISTYAVPGIANFERIAKADRKEIEFKKAYQIIFIIANRYGVKEKDLVSKKRNKEIMKARHIAINLIRSATLLRLVDIGKIFSRDHTTIIHSLFAVNNWIDTDKSFAREYKATKLLV